VYLPDHPRKLKSCVESVEHELASWQFHLKFYETMAESELNSEMGCWRSICSLPEINCMYKKLINNDQPYPELQLQEGANLARELPIQQVSPSMSIPSGSWICADKMTSHIFGF
jgi:hypothetical protein